MSAAASSAHSKVAPDSLVKEKDGLELVLGLVGFADMPTVGAAVSTVHVKDVPTPVTVRPAKVLGWNKVLANEPSVY